MSAGGAATRGDAQRVDTEGFGVGANVAEGGFSVFNALRWGCAVGFCGSVLCGDGDHPALSEVPALRVKLRGGSAHPTASEKEDNGWAVVFSEVVVRRENVEVEFDGLFLCVGGGLVRNELRFGGLLGVRRREVSDERERRDEEVFPSVEVRWGVGLGVHGFYGWRCRRLV